jgi:adenylate cyclase class 2
MIEVEVKVRISNPDKVRKKLEENNATYKISLHHEDYYFNMPKGLRDFKETDEALRLRRSTEIHKNSVKGPRKVSSFITYKGKKIDSLTKTRKEIEVKTDNFDKTIEILEILGFQKVLKIKKERELYTIEYKLHEIDALIDYIPILDQYFLEVEVLTNAIDNVEVNRKVLFELLNLLGIKKNQSIRESYLELIINSFKS